MTDRSRASAAALAGLMLAAAQCLAAQGVAAPRIKRIDPPSEAGAVGPNLTVIDDAVVLTWLERVGEGEPARHRLRVSALHGKRWGAAGTITEGPDILANWADFPSLSRAGDGAWVAHWALKSPAGKYASDVHLGRSEDAGRTWKPLGAVHDDGTPTEHGFVSLASDRDGARVVWLDGRLTASEGPMTLRTGLATHAPGPSEVLDDRVCDCCGTAMAQTDEGLVVAYRDRSPDEVRDISVVRRQGERWTPPESVHADGWKMPGCPVNGPALAARGRDVAVAWFTGADNRPRVQVAFSADAGATFGEPIAVDAASPTGRVSIALEPKGEALVLWMAEHGAVRLRRVVRTGAMGEPLDIVQLPPARTSGFPRLVIRGKEVVVAYTDPGAPSRVHVALLPRSDVLAARRPEPVSPASAAVASDFNPLQVAAQDLGGAAVDLRSLKGEVVLVNLWATWCVPCRRELPALAALHERFGANGLRIVGLSADEDAAALAAFVKAQSVPYRIVRSTAPLPQRAVVPSTWLFARDGRLVWHREGEVSADDPALRAALDAALAISK